MRRDSVPGAGTTRGEFSDGVRGVGCEEFFCFSFRARFGIAVASVGRGRVGWDVAWRSGGTTIGVPLLVDGPTDDVFNRVRDGLG